MSTVAWKITTRPALEPITLEEAKAELGLAEDDTSSDARLTRLIQAGREAAESYTGRAFITQTITLQLDTFPHARGQEPWWDGVRQGPRSLLSDSGKPAALRLPRPPLLEVLTIAYVTPDGAPAALDVNSAVMVDTTSEPGRIIPLGAWPATRERLGVTITYRAGYGPNASDVPAGIAAAIMEHVRDSYERPNAAITGERIDNAQTTYAPETQPGRATHLRNAARAMLEPYRLRDLGTLTGGY